MENQDSPSNCFCIKVPNNFAGEPFCAVLQIFPVAKMFMDKKGGWSIRIIRRKLSVSQCRKLPWGWNFLMFQKFPVSKKIHASVG